MIRRTILGFSKRFKCGNSGIHTLTWVVRSQYFHSMFCEVIMLHVLKCYRLSCHFSGQQQSSSSSLLQVWEQEQRRRVEGEAAWPWGWHGGHPRDPGQLPRGRPHPRQLVSGCWEALVWCLVSLKGVPPIMFGQWDMYHTSNICLLSQLLMF